ncbi:MAG: hypothetical protein MUF49_21660 [Oculatellaceae cyanobacterium Prado106]|jgi:hypothetical protein|nr:hypothetical protein [Oculatellaceae cyanobacterium Prado106]
MDLLQDQVASLTLKVDALHQIVDGLNRQTTEILSEIKSRGGEKGGSQSGVSGTRYSHPRSSFDEEMEHKDVLVDVRFPDTETQGGDRHLSLEVQVQRLTAQLTAAYNRIAALEEQLLSKRIPM